MKKSIVALVASALLSSSTLLANTLVLDWAPNHSPSGGEFILTPAGGDPFRSFCIERSEHVSLGGTYNYVPNYQAVGGGLGGPHPDPISVGTAYLYSQFRLGTLLGALNAPYDTSSTADQTDLQNAIWWLEQEIGSLDINGNPEDPYDPSTNQYLIAAKAALGASSFTDLQVDSNGAYGVGVYNLYTVNSDGSLTYNQDQLALVPDGGSTLVLLGLAFTGFAFIPRRKKQ